ncbi:FMN reductase [Klebsiella pneumoniae]|uniref:FMN reductase n=1 Tax=Klebsiella pneumoniae TaxID=573 RepID=A0A2X3G803_KLEPN|nr:FMN reductase [Klebsiella pneumoniae]
MLPLATGGTIAHMLAVDYALKPVLNALKAQEIPPWRLRWMTAR